jgi:hypothetical protein
MSESDAGVRAQATLFPAQRGARLASSMPHDKRFPASGLATDTLARVVRAPGSGKTALIATAAATSFRQSIRGATSQAGGER